MIALIGTVDAMQSTVHHVSLGAYAHPLTHIVLQQLTSETHPLNAHSNVT